MGNCSISLNLVLVVNFVVLSLLYSDLPRTDKILFECACMHVASSKSSTIQIRGSNMVL